MAAKAPPKVPPAAAAAGTVKSTDKKEDESKKPQEVLFNKLLCDICKQVFDLEKRRPRLLRCDHTCANSRERRMRLLLTFICHRLFSCHSFGTSHCVWWSPLCLASHLASISPNSGEIDVSIKNTHSLPTRLSFTICFTRPSSFDIRMVSSQFVRHASMIWCKPRSQEKKLNGRPASVCKTVRIRKD